MSMAMVMSIKMMMKTNPISMAISVLLASFVVAMQLYKSNSTSWLPFVTILTFSSGMMTLFMYTTAICPNEKPKTKKLTPLPMILIILICPIISNNPKKSTSMKNFSDSTMIMILTTILIATMLAMANHGHHPNQTLSSSF